jgi:hypothetical protein
MPEKAKFIDSKDELMNYANFKGRSFSTRYKVYNPQG